jgi:adenine-specific DNA-methyltransferase
MRTKKKKANGKARLKNNGASYINGNGSTQAYQHPTADSPMRPEVGTQPQFKKTKLPKTYRYDSSLAPCLEWDTKISREQGEKLIAEILNAKSIEEARTGANRLKRISTPFLNWSGKAERLSFDVPTLPLFIHERLSTKAIMETIRDRKRDKQMEVDLFADPQHPVTEQILKAYEHRDRWVNRMILADSVVAMNSLLEYENMAGKVQMIYMDPPYGVKFGSNFQPFVRSREVAHNDDDALTREPETVKAYRDTWELGTHSYLTYLRDRLLLSRSLLNETGSIFVQISDDNSHLVRSVLDEIFGADNFCAEICFQKTGGQRTNLLSRVGDFLLWYAKDITRIKYNQLYLSKGGDDEIADSYSLVELPDGTRRSMLREEKDNPSILPKGSRRFQATSLTSQNPGSRYEVKFKGKTYLPNANQWWKTDEKGMTALIQAKRIIASESTLRFVRYLDDFAAYPITSMWTDTAGGVGGDKLYVVQTNTKVVERCMLMTTDPGDLVIDPSCGSGTTAFCAEVWGRRWITMDVSRVPLALARQRLLTATYPFFTLKAADLGPSGGFAYTRKQNARGEEVGGLIPHITLKSIANGELGEEAVLVDRPDVEKGVVRVTGPFVVEATIPKPVESSDESNRTDNSQGPATEDDRTFADRMIEVLRRSPVLRIDKTHEIKLKDVRRPAKTLALSAEALAVNGQEKFVAFVFGPENASMSERLIWEAAREAKAKNYAQLIAIGFAVEPNARLLIDKCEEAVGIPAMYVQATPDLIMGDLLKTMRSSQIFSVCGLPDFRIKKIKPKAKGESILYQVILNGLDTFDPTSMELCDLDGKDVPAWFLDSNYNNLVFHVDKAFFPRTGAWDNLKKSLKSVYDDDVWKHLAGSQSALFEAGAHSQVAVKVIDERGNELVAVRSLKDVEE